MDVIVRGEENFATMANFYNAFRRHDPISAFLYHDMTDSTQNEYVSVRYNPQKSSPQEVNVALTFMSDEQGKQSSRLTKKFKHANVRDRSGSDNMAEPSSYENREEELLQKVQADIQDAKAHVFDASISFGKHQGKSGYSFTVAHASSPVSQKSRVLFYYNGKPLQSSEQTKPYQASFIFYNEVNALSNTSIYHVYN